MPIELPEVGFLRERVCWSSRGDAMALCFVFGGRGGGEEGRIVPVVSWRGGYDEGRINLGGKLLMSLAKISEKLRGLRFMSP